MDYMVELLRKKKSSEVEENLATRVSSGLYKVENEEDLQGRFRYVT